MKVTLTVLSDKICQSYGVIIEKNETELVPNVRRELCGAFIHKINTTFVNYTMKSKTKKKLDSFIITIKIFLLVQIHLNPNLCNFSVNFSKIEFKDLERNVKRKESKKRNFLNHMSNRMLNTDKKVKRIVMDEQKKTKHI